MFGKAARTVLVRLALIFLVLLPAGCKSLPGLEFLSSSEPAPAVAADDAQVDHHAVDRLAQARRREARDRQKNGGDQRWGRTCERHVAISVVARISIDGACLACHFRLKSR